MGEVGLQGPSFHAEAGAHAHAAGIEQVLTLGELAKHTAQACPEAQHMDSMAALQNAVLATLPNITTVLVKGSRFMHMERVVQSLLSLNPTQAPMHPQETPCC
jgi:UDP-N-acetylmuramoyl-tripeptide--D-alanyl-D-alanine ligase